MHILFSYIYGPVQNVRKCLYVKCGNSYIYSIMKSLLWIHSRPFTWLNISGILQKIGSRQLYHFSFILLSSLNYIVNVGSNSMGLLSPFYEPVHTCPKRERGGRAVVKLAEDRRQPETLGIYAAPPRVMIRKQNVPQMSPRIVCPQKKR